MKKRMFSVVVISIFVSSMGFAAVNLYLTVKKSGSEMEAVTFKHVRHKKHAIDAKKCKTCHHVGKWKQSCSEAGCHDDPEKDKEGKRIHITCLETCHAANEDAGPTDCMACHGQGNTESEPTAAQAESKLEITQEELKAAVPALDDLHTVVHPLWHKAYPQKDYDLIKKLLPQADELTKKLNAAKLPGILRDKQNAWDQGKENLNSALERLHEAADADDHQGMLEQTEAFHSAFERLLRTILPIVPELDAFHRELYKLYHYYAPGFDLPNIRLSATAMREKIPALKQARLPQRLSDRQEEFSIAVDALDMAVNELVETAESEDREKILKTVEKVHNAYLKAEHIFD